MNSVSVGDGTAGVKGWRSEERGGGSMGVVGLIALITAASSLRSMTQCYKGDWSASLSSTAYIQHTQQAQTPIYLL